MSSRKEEERNEKIIRGLMKLPPNRRCINCNSLGPQYVCTNFWTFICTTCSGIHREFTHRVKSVSMAKFTSQEVEALENGGNQRARDIFLKDWDMQRQRLPDSSNADKIRDFIKSVYVDKKYAGGSSSEKPPRDMQGHKKYEEDTRRASSYHSYSQSPPYDHQYEDRRYGKQAGMLTRKPGSDRVHYDGKFSSFVYSPGHTAGQMFEDRFANEGSAPRFSDYSVSSAGDTSRHDGQSPNNQKDSGYSSPPAMQVRNILIEDGRRQTLNTFLEADGKGEPRDVTRVPLSQRAKSSGSFGSIDSNSPSLKSVNSASLIDVIESDQSTGTQPAEASLPSSSQQIPVNANAVDQNLFSLPSAQSSANSSTLSIDLFAEINNPLSSTSLLTEASLPSVSPQLSLNTNAADHHLFNLPLAQSSTHSSAPFIDLFAEINNPRPSTSSWDQKPFAVPILENEGWATFDMPPHPVSTSEKQSLPLPVKSIGDVTPTSTFDGFSPTSNNLKWDSVQSSVAREPVIMPANQQNIALHESSVSSIPSNSQSWNAFDGSIGNTTQTAYGNPLLEVPPQIPVYKPPESVDSYMGTNISEDSSKNKLLGITEDGVAAGHIMPFSDNKAVPSFSPPTPMLGENIHQRKSTNPFDFPYESDFEPSNAQFLDMNSLKATLPNTQFPTAFPATITQPWFPQNASPPYISSVPSGGLPYMGSSSSQLPNLASQGPVASGNPFA